MRIGVSAAQGGRLANPAALRGAAQAAEQLGYSSVWAGDGLGGGVEPWLDPVAVLGAVAAVTSRVRIGLAQGAQPAGMPPALARALASLDVLSDGRLTVALTDADASWASGRAGVIDDLDAAAASSRLTGVVDDLGAASATAGLEGLLDDLDAAWAGQPLPVQRPRPPVLLGGRSPAHLSLVAARADGWHAAGVPVDLLGPMWQQVQAGAARHGRDTAGLELVVRADLVLLDRPVPGARAAYCGDLDQVAADLDATRRAGAAEVILGFPGDVGFDEALDAYARVTEAAGALARMLA